MRDKRLMLLALGPAALGGLAALVLSAGWLPDPLGRLSIWGDRAGLLLAAGVFLSVVLALVMLGTWFGTVWGWRQGAVTREEQARERELFHGRLNHELKNPLQVIYGALGNIQRETLSPAGRASLGNAQGEIRHLALLVHNLRKVAGVATQPMEMEDVDMAEVVEGAAAAIREQYPALAGEAGRRLVVRVDRRPWQHSIVCGDPGPLAQALHNLIENACKFSPPESPVEVSCVPEGDWLCLRVADSGRGIPDEDLAHLGTDLFRSANAHDVPGYGLGLSLVRAVVVRHGGEMNVASQVGEGTVVTLRLPLARRLPSREKRR